MGIKRVSQNDTSDADFTIHKMTDDSVSDMMSVGGASMAGLSDASGGGV